MTKRQSETEKVCVRDRVRKTERERERERERESERSRCVKIKNIKKQNRLYGYFKNNPHKR